MVVGGVRVEAGSDGRGSAQQAGDVLRALLRRAYARSVTRWCLWILLAAMLSLGGCGLGPGPQRAGSGAELRITRDFGQQRLAARRVERVHRGQTVMRLLQESRRVTTRGAGGRFVQSIDGLAGEGATGRRDWFYFVNGIEAETGAAERVLAPGDVVQWDYRRWDRARRVPAIVGAYPEPFVNGIAGKRVPTRIECEDDRGSACREVKQRLGREGVPVTSAPLGVAAGPDVARVVVAAWPRARTLRSAAVLEDGPGASGVFARFAESGRRLELLDADGRVARAAPPGTGLVAATRGTGGELIWLVTGLDDRGVEAAARALDGRTLRDAFAVAAEPSGPVPLPVGARSAVGRAARP